jgi:hypothetical protein
MAKRIIVGLKWAKRLEARPNCIPVGRSRGVKALGIRYEKVLAESYGSLRRGTWYEFEDKNGHGYCQTDFEFYDAERKTCVVLELKHTWTEDGHVELAKLYLPVVRAAGVGTFAQVVGVVVSKKLLGHMPGTVICDSMALAASMASTGNRAVWHWMPSGIRASRGRKLRHSSALDLGSEAA